MRPVFQSMMDKNELPDMSGMVLDKSIPHKERLPRLLAHSPDPHCFRYGDMAVKLEFAENGPSLQDALVNFLIRQKSGL